jgi:hypothetical protein
VVLGIGAAAGECVVSSVAGRREATMRNSVVPTARLGVDSSPPAGTRPGPLPQPLCAVYRRAATLAPAREHLALGRLALRALLDELRVEWLEGERLRLLDPDGIALLNVNTPEEHARAEALVRAASL